MDRDRMFEIVDGVRARAGGDVDRMAVELFDTLCALDPSEVVGFHRECGRQHRRMFVHPLWCAGDFAMGPLSDDAFADLRTHLLFQGLEAVDEVLAQPDALAAHLPADLDQVRVAHELAAAAPDAYQYLTGVDLYEAHPRLATTDLPDGHPLGAVLAPERREDALPRLARWRRERTPSRSRLHRGR
ncbi:DUF4240 domain-containing protein [Arthrobacter sp. NEB 688]|uniref:DUF4240 domain-containing protein n=1 Tax=Arthrobacter sp. NEB 688 TaxID=904039 RepID=UPI0015635307|nr:DUF4240 domain-containing protein [Arthrobacter sp. NEB 688]QKE83007.1 DUF4240 domain-containing protein [Arthrobacter sp. NEB 688]